MTLLEKEISHVINPASPPRIGLYGGSFDPVHCGHLLVAQAAMEEFGFTRLFFIPAARSPFKPERQLAADALRARLLRLALAGENRYELDVQELERGGTSYTIDTVRYYGERFPKAELYYLIGADHLSQLPRWREAGELADRVQFIVANRPGDPPPPAPESFRVHQMKGFPFEISSSQIRARIQAGLPIHRLVPTAVAEVIRKEQPYRENHALNSEPPPPPRIAEP